MDVELEERSKFSASIQRHQHARECQLCTCSRCQECGQVRAGHTIDQVFAPESISWSHCCSWVVVDLNLNMNKLMYFEVQNDMQPFPKEKETPMSTVEHYLGNFDIWVDRVGRLCDCVAFTATAAVAP